MVVVMAFFMDLSPPFGHQSIRPRSVLQCLCQTGTRINSLHTTSYESFGVNIYLRPPPDQEGKRDPRPLVERLIYQQIAAPMQIDPSGHFASFLPVGADGVWVFPQGPAEDVAAFPVGDEKKIIRRRRIKRGFDRSPARIADRSRRKPSDEIGVVGRVEFQIARSQQSSGHVPSRLRA